MSAEVLPEVFQEPVGPAVTRPSWPALESQRLPEMAKSEAVKKAMEVQHSSSKDALSRYLEAMASNLLGLQPKSNGLQPNT